MPARIERARPEHRAELAAYIASLNARPEHLCPYLSDKLHQVEHELDEYLDFGHSLEARADGELLGFLGAELDAELGRLFVYGPFVTHEPWDALADRLWGELGRLLPQKPLLLELYFGRSNANGEAFAGRHGFMPYKQSRLMRFPAERLERLTAEDAPDMMPEQIEQIVPLHDRLFPNTYLPGQSMVTGLTPDKRCFVVSEGDEVLGYLYGEVVPEVQDAFIEFVGTEERARSRGVGGRLVTTALRWMLSYEGIDEVWLSVDENNLGAQRLYERLGWDVVTLTQAFRLQSQPSP